jgi:hypothetical protein
MTTKVSFSLKFVGLNAILSLILFLLHVAKIIVFPSTQFNFILICSLLIMVFSLTLILPAIGGKKETFIIQFLVLIIMQLVFMLSICTYEVYVWGKKATEAILFQLIPFAWILITQTILLYRYSLRN